jgi:hypothetical protein
MAAACVSAKKFETDFKLIKQGAEAKLYEGEYLGRPTIVKERFKKSYRHVDLDNHLTKERMKSEARALLRCKIAGIHLFTIEFCRFRSKIFILWQVVCGRFYFVVIKLFSGYSCKYCTYLEPQSCRGVMFGYKQNVP